MKIFPAATAVIILILSGCSGPEYIPPARMPRRRTPQPPIEIPELVPYRYGGADYRDPFALPGAQSGAAARLREPVLVNPDMLKVTGCLSASSGKIVLLSGPGESYIAREGRLYDSEENKLPGVAAVIRKESIMLITEQDELYEFSFPDD